MKNWKTTLCGILAIVIHAAYFYPPAIPYIEPVTAILIATGLYNAQDASKNKVEDAAK